MSSSSMNDFIVYMPDGSPVVQGGPEDRATWWTCEVCRFHGPNVGLTKDETRACMGVICGGVTQNPTVPRFDHASTNT